MTLYGRPLQKSRHDIILVRDNQEKKLGKYYWDAGSTGTDPAHYHFGY